MTPESSEEPWVDLLARAVHTGQSRFQSQASPTGWRPPSPVRGESCSAGDCRIPQAHVVHRMIANREKRYDDAIAELAKSRPQDRYVTHPTALVHQATGVTTRG